MMYEYPDEITIYAKAAWQTGSKVLYAFSSRQSTNTLKAGDRFESGGKEYVVERIEDASRTPN
jgi:hypothetical protein